MPISKKLFSLKNKYFLKDSKGNYMKFKIYFRILSMIKYFQMQNLLEFLKFTEKQTHQFSFLRVNLETLLCKKMFVYFSLAFLLTQWLPFLKNKHLLQNNYCIALVYHPFCQILEYLCESLAMPHSFFSPGNDSLHGFVGYEFLNPFKIHIPCNYEQKSSLFHCILASQKEDLS